MGPGGSPEIGGHSRVHPCAACQAGCYLFATASRTVVSRLVTSASSPTSPSSDKASGHVRLTSWAGASLRVSKVSLCQCPHDPQATSRLHCREPRASRPTVVPHEQNMRSGRGGEASKRENRRRHGRPQLGHQRSTTRSVSITTRPSPLPEPAQYFRPAGGNSFLTCGMILALWDTGGMHGRLAAHDAPGMMDSPGRKRFSLCSDAARNRLA